MAVLPQRLGPLPAGFGESYTLAGCAAPAHCATFRRVAARCERAGIIGTAQVDRESTQATATQRGATARPCTKEGGLVL